MPETIDGSRGRTNKKGKKIKADITTEKEKQKILKRKKMKKEYININTQRTKSNKQTITRSQTLL